jgi:G3E family GTPase
MTAETSTTARILPVSILTGPSARSLLLDIVSRSEECRFGLLANIDVDSQPANDRLLIERLVAAGGGGYDPEQVRAQVAQIAQKTEIDHLIIECDANTHPIAFASLFLPDGGKGESFSEIARLSSILLAIDSETLLNSIVRSNHAPGVTSSCILADQIECADVIVLTGESAERDCMLARAVASTLNPGARVFQRSGEMWPSQLLDGAHSFDFEAAFAGAGWRKLMTDDPATRRDDQTVTTFLYRARRPFHPEKFWNLIQSPFPGVFRAKGFFWLATRMGLVGGLNIAGSECHFSPAGQWWAAANAHDHDSGHTEIPDRLKKEWAEPFGDRRQAIAFMGIELNSADLVAQLDACLLSESEMISGERSWETLPDPFPAWSARTHDHDCEEHDCCHH